MSRLLPRPVLLLLWIALASAQSVQPSNATLSAVDNITTQLKVTGPSIGQLYFNILPLTAQIGQGQGVAAVDVDTAAGNFKQVGPSNENNVTRQDLVYICCDPNTATSNIPPSSVVATVAAVSPQAIVLYSLTSNDCTLTGSFNYVSIYSMTSPKDSLSLLNAANSQPTNATALIKANSTTSGAGAASTTAGTDTAPVQTTAVAMSILYSITGIITLLFLVIIATGAIRAHRHPERYGPRTGVAGRPRQSRAKGLARAMLETLPIVKFGDPEPAKAGSRDVELEDGTTSVHTSPDGLAVTDAAMTERSNQAPRAEVESGLGPDTQAASINSGDEAMKQEGELGCSICTEDFMTGEDVRVLPCHHKYHPACIDPWLLNVSGTCPLCRHDLRPVTSTDGDPDSPAAEGSELPPPLAINEGAENGAETTAETAGAADATANPQSTRVGRFLELRRLRHAPPDERIAALRQLREQSQRDGEPAEDVEERSRRTRLTSRLRDTFRIRTGTQNVPAPE